MVVTTCYLMLAIGQCAVPMRHNVFVYQELMWHAYDLFLIQQQVATQVIPSLHSPFI